MTRLCLYSLLLLFVSVLASLQATGAFLAHTRHIADLEARDREHTLLMTTVIKDAFESNRLLADAANGKVKERLICVHLDPDQLAEKAEEMMK